MYLRGMFLGLLSIISLANAMDHPFPDDQNPSNRPMKKRKQHHLSVPIDNKQEDLHETIDEGALMSQIGVLSKQFRQSVENKVFLTLAHPALVTKNQKTTQKSYWQVGALLTKLEEEISTKQEEVTGYKESLENIQSIIDEGYDESHEIISNILMLYKQPSYEEFLQHVSIIDKKINGLTNLQNYLKKIQRKNVPLVDKQITRKNLIHFMKKEDSAFRDLMQTHAKLIQNILDDLGF